MPLRITRATFKPGAYGAQNDPAIEAALATAEPAAKPAERLKRLAKMKLPDVPRGPEAPDTLTFCLPLPPKELHQNARPARWDKIRATKRYRATVCQIAQAAMRASKWGTVKHATFQLTYYVPGRNDKSNLAGWFKAGEDGIGDARIWRDDEYATPLPIIIKQDATSPRVEITIKEV